MDRHVEPDEDTIIPVPWGYISAKWWGSKERQPVVCIHGWQDNAGTFDTLIPLLPTNISFLCIDLPGHGRSSHIPEGMAYYLTWDGVAIVRRLVKHYGWEKIAIMGHSLGGIIGFMYAALYPDEVSSLISLDVVAPTYEFREKTSSINNGARWIDTFLHYDEIKQSKDPVDNYETMIDITFAGHNNRLTRKSCEVMMIRGMKRRPDGNYSFTRDNRVKVGFTATVAPEVIRTYAKKIKCRYLNVKAKPVDEELWPVYKEICDIIASSCKEFALILAEGTHHVHLNDPEKVAPEISDFLQNGNLP